jgi:flagellar biosynthesis/type III secretory pathway M-ring protein FliF/YscJ
VEALRQIIRQLDAWWAYVTWCAGAPVSTPACKTFWTWTAIVGGVIGLLVAWKILAWLLRPLRLWLEEKRRLARERKVADEATMAQYKVDDSKLYSGPGQENVEQKIREALLEKKLTDQQQRHHQRTGDKKP